MNRRGFLRGLLGVAASAAIAPVVPRVIYAFAPPLGWRRGSNGLYAIDPNTGTYTFEMPEQEAGFNFLDLPQTALTIFSGYTPLRNLKAVPPSRRQRRRYIELDTVRSARFTMEFEESS